MDVCFSLLDETEGHQIWERVRKELAFRPSVDRSVTPFRLPAPWMIHDISPIFAGRLVDSFKDTVRQALVDCMGDDPWCYALDWYHSYFRYDPRRPQEGYGLWVEDERDRDGGYDVSFPNFFPDGDYYFFLQRDLKWGYLGHPWRQELWLFGRPLVEELSPRLEELGLPLKSTSERS